MSDNSKKIVLVLIMITILVMVILVGIVIAIKDNSIIETVPDSEKAQRYLIAEKEIQSQVEYISSENNNKQIDLYKTRSNIEALNLGEIDHIESTPNKLTIFLINGINIEFEGINDPSIGDPNIGSQVTGELLEKLQFIGYNGNNPTIRLSTDTSDYGPISAIAHLTNVLSIQNLDNKNSIIGILDSLKGSKYSFDKATILNILTPAIEENTGDSSSTIQISDKIKALASIINELNLSLNK